MNPLSYSGLQLYIKCPHAFEQRYVIGNRPKSKAPKGKALSRGLEIHRGIEEYLLGWNDDLPRGLEFYKEFFDGLIEMEVIPEWGWAFDKNWEASDFDGETTAIRGFADALVHDGEERTVHVYEYKTGSRYHDHIDQRSLYGLAALLAYPKAEEAIVTTMYLDSHKNSADTYRRDMLVSHQWIWDNRIKRTLPPQNYPKNPGRNCKWCDYNVKNGGTCEPPARS